MSLAEKIVGNSSLKRLTWGMHDAIIGNEIVRDIPSKVVYVSAESELSNFADEPAGTVAVQYGFAAIWQKKPDGTWATV